MHRYNPPKRGTVAHHRNMAAILLKELRYEMGDEFYRMRNAVRRHLNAAHDKGFKLP